jgi:hypothetical protein
MKKKIFGDLIFNKKNNDLEPDKTIINKNLIKNKTYK